MRRERLKQKGTSQSLTRPYEPTPQERAAVEAYFARKKGTPPSPNLKVSKKGQVADVSLDHPEPGTGQLLLMHALGSTDPAFVNGLLTQLANASSKGRDTDESGLNFMLSVVKAIEPKDEVETMIAAQMAAIHVATMTFACRLNHVENIPQQDSAERALNKLARTFTTQMEALNRHRGKGQQKVTVEHVHVHEGGQAIVGHVERRGDLSKPEVGVTTQKPRMSEPTQ
jgi:hypothetical protein